jgi:KaiC/GvpD/RAD55 family RecA-like ATPase
MSDDNTKPGEDSLPPLPGDQLELELDESLKLHHDEQALREAQMEREHYEAEWAERHDYVEPDSGFAYDYVQHAFPTEGRILPSVTAPASAQQAVAKGLRTRLLRDVKPEPVPWLWPKRIAFGTLCVIDGDPGSGKTTIVLDLMARLSRGDVMPFETEALQAMSSLVVSAEDSISNTLAPRLFAAGADKERLHFSLEPVFFPSGREKLQDTIRETRARLVMIDPLLAMLDDNIEPNQDAKMRQVLGPLAAIAAHTESAIVVVRHLNKALHSKTMYRGGSSIAIAAAARTCLLAAQAKGQMHLANYKSNLDVKAPTLTYELVGNENNVVTVRWKEQSAASADDVMDASLPPGYRSANPEERATRAEKQLASRKNQIVSFLALIPGATKPEIRKVIKGGRESVDEALDQLVAEAQIEFDEEQIEGKGGRPKRIYRKKPQAPEQQEDFDE